MAKSMSESASSETSEAVTSSSISQVHVTPPKRACSWSEECHMTRSKKGSLYAYCTVCQTNFSIASGGLHAIRQHVDGKKHYNY